MNKRTELVQIIALDNPDIISLTEIVPKNCETPIQASEIQIEGYECFNNLDKPTMNRGVAMYVKKSLMAVPSRMEDEFAESVWSEIPLKKGDRLLLGCIY
jgi:exonuclease III